ncbi:MAG: methylmalonyl-CoA epimerase [Actinomycetota bacterium]
MLTDIDHIGIAVSDLDEAVEHYRATLGLAPHHSETLESQGVREVLFEAGSSFIQLLEPLGPDTPVGKFLAKRGPGVHHVGYRVDDVAATLAHLASEGVPLIDEEPRIGSMDNMIAFIHPRGFDGVLVELVQERGRPHGA